MKWAFATLFFMMLTLSCCAQLSIPMGGSGSSGDSRKATKSTSRTLTGTVIDKGDKGIPNAVVYLKNTKTLAMKTYISQKDGTYRFPELSNNVDFEVYAQIDGKKSGAKTLSQFDDRDKPNINLTIDMNK